MIRGFVPDAGALQRLPRRIPYNIAVELLLTGRRMGADEAARWGLVSKVVPGEKLMSTANELAEKIAEGAPLAVTALLEVLPAIDRKRSGKAYCKGAWWDELKSAGFPRESLPRLQPAFLNRRRFREFD